MIRGVYAALMVVSTAIGPVLLGGALAADVSLLAIGIWLLAYAVVVPAVLVPGIRGFEERSSLADRTPRKG
jgi:hypothetical protein